VSNIQRECEWYSTTLRTDYFQDALEACKNYGVAVYVPKVTILKEMAVKIE
jgi:hypothetical protein